LPTLARQIQHIHGFVRSWFCKPPRFQSWAVLVGRFPRQCTLRNRLQCIQDESCCTMNFLLSSTYQLNTCCTNCFPDSPSTSRLSSLYMNCFLPKSTYLPDTCCNNLLWDPRTDPLYTWCMNCFLPPPPDPFHMMYMKSFPPQSMSHFHTWCTKKLQPPRTYQLDMLDTLRSTSLQLLMSTYQRHNWYM